MSERHNTQAMSDRPRRRYDVRRAVAALGIQAQGGEQLEAKCPYHADRNPSWFIHAEGERQGSHYCRSCGSGGGLADLVAHVRGYASVASAREWLEPFEVTGAGPLPATTRVERAAFVEFRPPKEVIWEPLEKWVHGARAYAERRGITAEQVGRWGIGYALDGRLAGRIVVPMRGPSGEVTNYFARIFAGEGPRYMNPANEHGADPAAVFGEGAWPEPRERRHWRVTVFEGALKALAFERALPEDYFAVLGGTQVRPLHVAKLCTFGEVVVATDGDDAGDSAGDKLAPQLLRHVKVSRVRTPRDPDEMAPAEIREMFR